MQKGGEDGLLYFAETQRRYFGLDVARFGKLAFQDSRPLLFLAFILFRFGHIGQFARRLGEGTLPRLADEDVGGDQRAVIPSPGIAQGQGKGAQDAARALEALHIRPLGIEQLGQVWMERIALHKALFCRFHILAGLLVKCGYAF